MNSFMAEPCTQTLSESHSPPQLHKELLRWWEDLCQVSISASERGLRACQPLSPGPQAAPALSELPLLKSTCA